MFVPDYSLTAERCWLAHVEYVKRRDGTWTPEDEMHMAAAKADLQRRIDSQGRVMLFGAGLWLAATLFGVLLLASSKLTI